MSRKKDFYDILNDILQTVINSKISCISTLFKKEISILIHIAKKLQAHQFLKNYFYAQGFVKTI